MKHKKLYTIIGTCLLFMYSHAALSAAPATDAAPARPLINEDTWIRGAYMTAMSAKIISATAMLARNRMSHYFGRGDALRFVSSALLIGGAGLGILYGVRTYIRSFLCDQSPEAQAGLKKTELYSWYTAAAGIAAFYIWKWNLL